MDILIVDDNQDNRMTLELLLEEFEGLTIEQVEDGEAAVELCKKQHFDIIFMDIMMPGIDGITATEVIKSFDKKVMIIALSALDDELSKNEILANGAEDYITKPIESELFHQRVKNYLEIVAFRKEKPSNEDAVNSFTQEVYSRSLKFTIKSKHSLAELWDYYLNEYRVSVETLEECIRMIYAYGQVTLKNDASLTLTAEENDDYLFLTLAPLGGISDLVIQHTLLKNYKQADFILSHHQLSFRLKKGQPIQENLERLDITDYEQRILSKTHFNKTTASEYVENTAISLMDKIEDLENIELSIEKSAIAFERDAQQDDLIQICADLDSYVEVVDQLMEFEHFAYALKNLNDFLKTLNLSELDPNDQKKFSRLFLHLLDDITEWRNNIFIKKEANDIHYLDSSLLSSCLQIQSIFEKKEANLEDEGDFELF